MTSNQKKILLARLGRTRGLKGQLRVDLYNPDSDLFVRGQTFRVSGDLDIEKLTLSQYSQGWCFFKEVKNPEDAQKFVNQHLFLFRDELPQLKKGSYYHADLFGFSVMDGSTKEKVGILKDILYTASNDVWVVVLENKEELLIPMLDDILDKIDLDQKQIFLRIPDVI